MSVSFNSK
jgi:hypothetical protein